MSGERVVYIVRDRHGDCFAPIGYASLAVARNVASRFNNPDNVRAWDGPWYVTKRTDTIKRGVHHITEAPINAE